MNILDKICETTKERIEKEKQKISLIEVRKIAESIKRAEKENYFNFEKAIGKKRKLILFARLKKPLLQKE